MWKRCRRHPRHIADTTTTLFPLTNTIWNQPDTLFPHPPRSVRTQKQRFVHHSVRSNARNAVSYLFLFGRMQSSCHNSFAHFSVAIMTPFLASNRTELPQCQPYSAIRKIEMTIYNKLSINAFSFLLMQPTKSAYDSQFFGIAKPYEDINPR